ncbi:hypothetical protein F2P56_022249 [Juglans regia]|uniref:Uncharacterized protein LOC109007609 n=2 Tax=Juglans regia TaxID=51240 RepID=A0A2I4GG85_JUGRE|nr:uncharacterized protein LOC109007609 [Juglans regia]KAF5458195.1 hypothetical protein F2P56_022249 [Juglans regia]
MQNTENRKRLTTNHTTGRKSFVRILEEQSPTSNLVDFYKEVRWSKKKDQFVSPTTEELYHKMVGKLSDLEPEVRTTEATTWVFRDVLGHKSGYAKGLGEMIIPESIQKQDSERDKQYVEVVKEAAYYKNEVAELRGDVRVLLERQQEYDKLINMLMSERQSRGDSLPIA